MRWRISRSNYNRRQLPGMISIGDVVKCRLDELETEAQALRDYVAGVQ